jgi:mono/diheme cytochrome c family protein
MDVNPWAGKLHPMGKQLLPILAGGLAGLVGFAAAAQELPGNPALGRGLALKVCVECHRVEPGESKGELPDPPAFQNLADDPAMTALALRVFLTTPHTNLPNLILSDAEVDDVIAYIHSLKDGQ